AFAEQLVNLTVKEVNELANILKEEYGIEPAAAAAVAVTGPAAAGAEGAQTEEKLSYSVMMNHPGGAKLQIVKLVKDITNLGLKEAKELVDKSPVAVKENLSKEEAESIKNQLAEAGADVELK
ncbi:MAG: 50S ribosomal protein L7/L12, partial [Bacteroidales bacterium]|nr:50S ribosomal protein L7/L12 [Bacteroidales bacterium]